MNEIRVLLIGNPNVGKTTLFNALCGMHQHTGNYPGVTVEVKEGTRMWDSVPLRISDLPGTYSLNAFTPDEMVARDALLTTHPDVIVQIVDATNIERNLFLTTQILDLEIPVIIALNMTDLAKEMGIVISPDCLSREIGVPVIPLVATKEDGIEELIRTVVRTANEGGTRPKKAEYPQGIREKQREISVFLGRHSDLLNGLEPSYAAMRLMEGDEELISRLHQTGLSIPVIDATTEQERDRICEEIMQARYLTAELMAQSVQRCNLQKVTPSDCIDQVLTHRIFGIPIFLSLMWFAFQLTFSVSAPFSAILELFFSAISSSVGKLGIEPLIGSFITDAVIGGVGTVFSFVPSIFILFLLLALLEDSGYLARAAFVMDRLMHSIGLHGRSFIPLLIGFGCNVPAIMATRTLQSRADRFITILSVPFISCAARLPVYVLIAGIFFGSGAGSVIFFLYVLGILAAMGTALLFRRFLFRDEPSPFIMELPPYRAPTIRAAAIHMWYKGKAYLERAGYVIFGGVILVWILASFPVGAEYGSAESYAGILGQVFQPLFAPLGFTWQLVVGLIFGFIAKEVVVGSLGTLYGGEDILGSSLAADPALGPATALAYMVFVLLYLPCIATLGVIRQEMGSWRWTALALGWGIFVAYILALVTKNVGTVILGGFHV